MFRRRITNPLYLQSDITNVEQHVHPYTWIAKFPKELTIFFGNYNSINPLFQNKLTCI